MKTHLLLIAAFALILTGCKKTEETTPAKPTNQNFSSGNPLTAPVDYLGAVSQAKKVAVKTIDLAYLNNAIQLFNANEDHYPRDLNELVAKHYVQTLPNLPAGTRLMYNPNNGEVRMVRQ